MRLFKDIPPDDSVLINILNNGMKRRGKGDRERDLCPSPFFKCLGARVARACKCICECECECVCESVCRCIRECVHESMYAQFWLRNYLL